MFELMVSIPVTRYRSSLLQMFFKIGVLKSLANFTGKHLCWSPFLRIPFFAELL